MLCSQVEPIVHGLEKAHGKKLSFKVRPFDEGDAPDLIKKYELGKHGMVITDGEGNKLWGAPGHKQTKEQVEKAIQTVVGA